MAFSFKLSIFLKCSWSTSFLEVYSLRSCESGIQRSTARKWLAWDSTRCLLLDAVLKWPCFTPLRIAHETTVVSADKTREIMVVQFSVHSSCSVCRVLYGAQTSSKTKFAVAYATFECFCRLRVCWATYKNRIEFEI